MATAEARILVSAITEDEGTYTLLRMGRDPGLKRVAELRQALRLLAREFADAKEFPRDIAYACAVILHFEEKAFLIFGTLTRTKRRNKRCWIT